MENSNEKSQSYIINLLVRFGSLNSIYNEVFENEKLTVSRQQKIYNFYNDFKDVETFESELLCFFYLDNQIKNLHILNQLKSRIQSNVSLYNDNSLFIDKIDVYEVCYYSVVDSYKSIIKLMSDSVWEYKNTRRILNRELDPPFGEPLSKQNEAGIRIELKRIEALEAKAQEELDFIHREKNTELNDVLKYKKNVFKDIRELGLRFITIINCYLSAEEGVGCKHQVFLESVGDSMAEIEVKYIEKAENKMFKPTMFKKHLDIEKMLIKEGCLDDSLNWNPIGDGKLSGLQMIIIFIDRLIIYKYFLPIRKDIEIRRFFEFRYNFPIGQSFEKKKREKYLLNNDGIFNDYPF